MNGYKNSTHHPFGVQLKYTGKIRALNAHIQKQTDKKDYK